jgi:hypothetical protein
LVGKASYSTPLAAAITCNNPERKEKKKRKERQRDGWMDGWIDDDGVACMAAWAWATTSTSGRPGSTIL